jgi:hypothetical protein
MVMNGGVECGGATEHIQSQNRIDYYREFANYFDVAIAEDEVLGCANMPFFDDQGSAALDIYWEKDWGYYPDKPNGDAYACKLVSYQTPHSALIPGDYQACVLWHFPDTIITSD